MAVSHKMNPEMILLWSEGLFQDVCIHKVFVHGLICFLGAWGWQWVVIVEVYGVQEPLQTLTQHCTWT